MAAAPPRPERRRARPGSLERPVNSRLYRGTWLLVGLPLLVAAFSVSRPAPLPPPPVPPAFDGTDAASLARSLASQYPDRFPGHVNALQAADWYRDELRPYGLSLRTERSTAVIPGHGRVQLQNIVAVAPGQSLDEIVVMAHRDDDGIGPGANDNASGTAVLLELARAYSVPLGTGAERLRPAHTIVFLSTDGGAFGGLGATAFLDSSPERRNVAAVVNLDAVGGRGVPRLEVNGDTPRSASGALLETAVARLARQLGRGPTRPSALRQLIDLGFPFSPYEQAPFISRGIPAVTITTSGDRPPPAGTDTAELLDENRINQVGRAAQDLVSTLDEGLEFAQGTSSYVYVGSRVIRGWAIELVLMALLLPFLATTIDLFARCRRRRLPLRPAFLSYRSRVAFWLAAVVLFQLFSWVGLWPGGTPRPPELTSAAARHWPAAGLLLLGALLLGLWLVVRDRLLPRRSASAVDELGGYVAALLSLGVVALLVVASNPFALIFVLPSAHAWLWLPNMRGSPRWARAAVLAAGLTGPGLLVWSFAFRFGLGWDAPWYLLELRNLGYAPFLAFAIAAAWVASLAQLAAIEAGRYAPYPRAGERPRLGPARRLLRRAVLASRARRRESERERRAFGG
jgi:peptidase M28-like protein